MNRKSTLIVLILAFLVVPGMLFPQGFQGKAFYKTKTTVNFDNWGGGQMSEEMKKRFQERMKSMLEKSFVLTFNREVSLYAEEDVLEAPGQGGGWRGMMGSFSGGPQYKDLKAQQFLQENEFFGKQFLVKDSLKPLEWKMGSETKQIGQYLVMKATAIKTVDEFDVFNMRRRNRENESEERADTTNTRTLTEDIEIPKTIEITAWYTPQIPVSHGPDAYWGLPGLILEVNAGRTTILCSKIVLNPESSEAIKAPSKGTEVTKKEYDDIVREKTMEMRDMFRRRGGGRRGMRN